MKFEFDIEAVTRNVRQATTEDLLDRATVYRADMEPAAVDVIEAELRERGVDAAEVEQHAADRAAAALTRGRVTVRCTFCDRPAVRTGVGWHRLWGGPPIFPRRMAYCAEHGGDTTT